MRTLTLPLTLSDDMYGMGMRFMLLDEHERPAHTDWWVCKDWYQDIWAREHHNQAASSVKGDFIANGGRLQLDLPTYTLAVSKPGTLGSKVKSIATVLHAFDKALGIEPCQVEAVNDNDVVLVTFANAWTLQPYLLSALTQLIRISPPYTKGPVAKFIQGAFDKPLCSSDLYRGRIAVPRLLALLDGRRFTQQWSHVLATSHSAGLVGADLRESA